MSGGTLGSAVMGGGLAGGLDMVGIPEALGVGVCTGETGFGEMGDGV